MPLNIPTFLTRLGSSVVFVAVMLTGLLWNEWSFLALVCLINFLCLREYMRLMQKVDKESYWPGWISVSVQAAALVWLFMTFCMETYAVHFSIPMLIFARQFPLLFIFAFIASSVLSQGNVWRAGMLSVFGILYIVVPLSLAISLYNIDHYLPLFIILLIWTNDTAAYLAGSFFGKTPFSSISPKKTWEGVIGATILTIAIGMVIGHFYSSNSIMPRLDSNMICFAILGFIVSVAGPAGDLFKSKFKRIADVKDSGNLMPGHGGALDRFDSLLMVIPFVYCAIYLALLL